MKRIVKLIYFYYVRNKALMLLNCRAREKRMPPEIVWVLRKLHFKSLKEHCLSKRQQHVINKYDAR